MSDIFTLDDEGQRQTAIEAQTNALNVSEANPGFFHGVTRAIGMGVMRGGAEAADVVQTLGRFFDEPGIDQQPVDELAAEIHHDSVDYWTPGPGEVGTAGQVLGGLSEIVLPLMATGGNPTGLIATETNKTGKRLVDEGVDATTAGTVAATQGVATYAGFKLPFLGKTLASRIGSGVGGNLLVNAGAAEVQHLTLEAAGESEAAKQFDPLDMQARLLDVLTGAVFGGIAHLQMRASDRAAVLTANNAKHFQSDTAPGRPLDIESEIAHQKAMEQATDQLMRGEPVTPPRELTEARFEPIERSPVEVEHDVPTSKQLETRAAAESKAYRALDPEPVAKGEESAPKKAPSENAPEGVKAAPSGEATTRGVPDAPEGSAHEPIESSSMPPGHEVLAARQAIEVNDVPVADVDADGNHVQLSGRELMTRAAEEVTLAKASAKAFDAAVTCFLRGGA